jgi:hypothetical protein
VRTPPENDLPVSALRQVKLRVNIFWSLSDTGVYSVNASQIPAEVISRAAKKLRELDAATGFVFNRASARNGYLTITMQGSRLPRRHHPFQVTP